MRTVPEDRLAHSAHAYFLLAGDPKAFPEQIAEGLTPWSPTRIFQNGGAGGLSIPTAGNDPVTGDSISTIASRTSAAHKTQFGPGGGGGRGGPGRGGVTEGGVRQESFTLLAGSPAKDDIMDGIDLTWARIPGGAEIGKLAADALAAFKPDDPAASVPASATASRARTFARSSRSVLTSPSRRSSSACTRSSTPPSSKP